MTRQGPEVSRFDVMERSDPRTLRTAGIVAVPDPRTIWSVKIQGRCAEVFRTLANYNYDPLPPRGIPGVLSRQSRMRLLREINRMNLEKHFYNLFITLTYPDHADCQKAKVRSQHRYLFLRYLEKHLGRKVACLWRQEWKPRLSGAYKGHLFPHIHMMVFNVQFIAMLRVNRWWQKSIGWEGYVRTEVQRVEGVASAARYLTKYVSKAATSLVISTYRNRPDFGRSWGLTRPSLIPYHPVALDRVITQDEADCLRTWYAEWVKTYNDEEGGGFTAFGPQAIEQLMFFLSPGIDEPDRTR